MSDQNAKGTIFISHSSKDNDTVHLIDDALQANGYKTWVDNKDIDAGSVYSDDIPDKIKTSDLFLIVVSNASLKSPHVKRELILYGKRTDMAIIGVFLDDLTPNKLQESFEYFLSGPNCSKYTGENDICILISEVNQIFQESSIQHIETQYPITDNGIRLGGVANTYRKHFCEDRLFLNDSKKKQLMLQQVFQIPDFKQRTDSDDSGIGFHNFFSNFLSHTHVEDEEYPEKPLERVLTILGKPGTGKTSLIQYIVSNENTLHALKSNNYNEVRIHKFSSLKNVDWESHNVPLAQSLLGACGFDTSDDEWLYDQLNGVLLILDGFDEIEPGKKREEILQELYEYFNCDTYKYIPDFSLIITCRTEYVENIKNNRVSYPRGKENYRSRGKNSQPEAINYITLQPLSRKKIIAFCRCYNQAMTLLNTKESLKAKYDESLLAKDELYVNSGTSAEDYTFSEVLGIPIILYMIIGRRYIIDYKNKSTTVVDIYDEIFQTEGGIFDPSDYQYNLQIKNNRRSNLPINEELLKISKLIAIEMFQHSPDKADCPDSTLDTIIEKAHARLCASEEYIKSGHTISKKELKKRVKGDNYIKYIEGNVQLSFVHRSIYEYFTACYIYDQLMILSNSESSEPERVGAKNTLRIILQTRMPSVDIRRYITQKIMSSYHFDIENMYQAMNTFFEEMIADRFLFHGSVKELEFGSDKSLTTEPEHDNPFLSMEQDVVCFLNMLFLLRECYTHSGRKDTYICAGDKGSAFQNYVKQAVYLKNAGIRFLNPHMTSDEKINTTGLKDATVDLSNISVPGIGLKGLDFSNVILNHSNLSNANLEHAVFAGSSIVGTSFEGAKMDHCSLRKATTTLPADKSRKDDLAPRNVFFGADLRNADLQSCILNYADFSGCHMENANLYAATLNNAVFDKAFLDGSTLQYAKLHNSSFLNASMIHVNLEDTELNKARFANNGQDGAELFGACFAGANVGAAHFDKAGKLAVKQGDGDFAIK